MTTGPEPRPPAGVPAAATQAGDIQARWGWVEGSVWTARMLTALEDGVKGGVWYALMDKVYRRANLWSAWLKVQANHGAAGIDGQSVTRFAEQAERQVDELAEQLRAGTYVPAALRRTYLPKPGSPTPRPLGIPAVRDRIVQGALRHVLEPIFERAFAASSYGFRPGRQAQDALRHVEALLRQGHVWVVDADLRSYFDTIPHAGLLARVRERVADGRVLTLLEALLHTDILEEGKRWTPAAGTPQGGVISPLLANVYLNPLDHLLAGQGFAMVRYADDFVVLCRTATEAQAALRLIQEWTATAGLALHPEKTRLVNLGEAGARFEFLGYCYCRLDDGRLDHWPRPKSLQKLKDRLRHLTPRQSGLSLADTIRQTNRVLRGWFAYFRHSNRWTFPRLDQWLRTRLRSLLRHRSHRRGRGRGYDHQRWPNAFFAAQGLYSLATAHAAAVQPTWWDSPSGEPDAGDPPVRFGGRGGAT